MNRRRGVVEHIRENRRHHIGIEQRFIIATVHKIGIIRFVIDFPVFHFGKLGNEIVPRRIVIFKPSLIITSRRQITPHFSHGMSAVIEIMVIHSDIRNTVRRAFRQFGVHRGAMLFVHRIFIFHQIREVHPVPHRFRAEICDQLKIRRKIFRRKRRTRIFAIFDQIAYAVQFRSVGNAVIGVERNFLPFIVVFRIVFSARSIAPRRGERHGKTERKRRERQKKFSFHFCPLPLFISTSRLPAPPASL